MLKVTQPVKEILDDNQLSVNTLDGTSTLKDFLTVLDKHRQTATDLHWQFLIFEGVGYLVGFMGAAAFKDTASEGIPYLLWKFNNAEVNGICAEAGSVGANGILNGYFFVKTLKSWFRNSIVYNTEERRAFGDLVAKINPAKFQVNKSRLDKFRVKYGDDAKFWGKKSGAFLLSLFSAYPYATLPKKKWLMGSALASYTALHLEGMEGGVFPAFSKTGKLLTSRIDRKMSYKLEGKPTKEQLRIVSNELNKVNEDIALLRKSFVRTIKRGVKKTKTGMKQEFMEENVKNILTLLNAKVEDVNHGKALSQICLVDFAKQYVSFIADLLKLTSIEKQSADIAIDAISKNPTKDSLYVNLFQILSRRGAHPDRIMQVIEQLKSLFKYELTNEKIRGLIKYLDLYTQENQTHKRDELKERLFELLKIKQLSADEDLALETITEDPKATLLKMIFKDLNNAGILNSNITEVLYHAVDIEDGHSIMSALERLPSETNFPLGEFGGFLELLVADEVNLDGLKIQLAKLQGENVINENLDRYNDFIDRMEIKAFVAEQMKNTSIPNYPKIAFTKLLLLRVAKCLKFEKGNLLKKADNLGNARNRETSLTDLCESLRKKVVKNLHRQDNIADIIKIIRLVNQPIVIDVDIYRIQEMLKTYENVFLTPGDIEDFNQWLANINLSTAVPQQAMGDVQAQIDNAKFNAVNILLQVFIKCLNVDGNRIKTFHREFNPGNKAVDWSRLSFEVDNIFIGKNEQDVAKISKLIGRIVANDIEPDAIKKQLDFYRYHKFLSNNVYQDVSRYVSIIGYNKLESRERLAKDKKALQLLITLQLIRDICEQAKAPNEQAKVLGNKIIKLIESGDDITEELAAINEDIRKMAQKWKISPEIAGELTDLITAINKPGSIDREQMDTLKEKIAAFYLKAEIAEDKTAEMEAALSYVSRVVSTVLVGMAVTGYFYDVVQMASKVFTGNEKLNWVDYFTGSVVFFPFAALIAVVGVSTGRKIFNALRHPINTFQDVFYFEDGKPTATTAFASLGYSAALFLTYFSAPTVLMLNANLIKASKIYRIYNGFATFATILFNIFPVPIIFDAIKDGYRTQILGKYLNNPEILSEMKLAEFSEELLGLVGKLSDERFLDLMADFVYLNLEKDDKLEPMKSALSSDDSADDDIFYPTNNYADEDDAQNSSRALLAISDEEDQPIRRLLTDSDEEDLRLSHRSRDSREHSRERATSKAEKELANLMGESFEDLVVSAKCPEEMNEPAARPLPTERSPLNGDNDNGGNNPELKSGVSIPENCQTFVDWIDYLSEFRRELLQLRVVLEEQVKIERKESEHLLSKIGSFRSKNNSEPWNYDEENNKNSLRLRRKAATTINGPSSAINFQ